MAKNPFMPAEQVQKKLKILLFGASGSGKTRASLTFPRVAMIDAEGGADLYAGAPDVSPFHILRTKTTSDLRDAINFIREDDGRTFDTLVIDPITVFYDMLKEAAARRTRDGQMGFREWARVNSDMKGIYNDLTQLPLHVVVIARESMEYEGSGHDLKKVGAKADSDRSLPYTFDFIVRLQPDHTGIVMKTRGITLGQNGRLPKVDYAVFAAAVQLAPPISTPPQPRESAEPKRRDPVPLSGSLNLGDDPLRQLEGAELNWLLKQASTVHLGSVDILAAHGVKKMQDIRATSKEAAWEMVNRWLEQQLPVPQE